MMTYQDVCEDPNRQPGEKDHFTTCDPRTLHGCENVEIDWLDRWAEMDGGEPRLSRPHWCSEQCVVHALTKYADCMRVFYLHRYYKPSHLGQTWFMFHFFWKKDAVPRIAEAKKRGEPLP